MRRLCLCIRVDRLRGLGCDEDQLGQARAQFGSPLVEGKRGPAAD